MSKSSVCSHGANVVESSCQASCAAVGYSGGQVRLNSGQALLMVVVAMIIILTVSLSVATRSVINIRTSSEEASSSAAFSAAEAGIERYLKNAQTFTGNIGTSNVSVNTTQIGGSGTNPSQIILNSGNPVLRDDGVDVWLSTYPGYSAPYYTNTVRVYWNTGTNCSTVPLPAAIEVVLISGPAVNTLLAPVTTRFAADPCTGSSRQLANLFNTALVSGGPFTVGGKQFTYAIDIPMPVANPNGIIARIVPLYANTIVAVTGSAGFPLQGSIVSSTGSSGETRRKITVYQGFPKVPNEFFSYTLFSP